MVIEESGAGHGGPRGRLGRGRRTSTTTTCRSRSTRTASTRCTSIVPGHVVYVTVSAARSPQEEADDSFEQPGAAAERPWPTRSGCALGNGAPRRCDARRRSSSATRSSTASLVDENDRALVLTFDSSNWNTRSSGSTCGRRHARRDRDRSALRGRPGRRHPAQRHLEQPAVRRRARPQRRGRRSTTTTRRAIFVTQIEKAAVCPGPRCTEDRPDGRRRGHERPGRRRRLHRHRRRHPDPAREGARSSARSWSSGCRWTPTSQQAISLANLAGSTRGGRSTPDGDGGTYYTITFDRIADTGRTRSASASIARDDGEREDPQTAVIALHLRPDRGERLRRLRRRCTNPTATFQFPNLRSGPGRTAVAVIDNDTAGVVVRESGTGTVGRPVRRRDVHDPRPDRRLLAAPDQAAGGPERPRPRRR